MKLRAIFGDVTLVERTAHEKLYLIITILLNVTRKKMVQRTFPTQVTIRNERAN